MCHGSVIVLLCIPWLSCSAIARVNVVLPWAVNVVCVGVWIVVVVHTTLLMYTHHCCCSAAACMGLCNYSPCGATVIGGFAVVAHAALLLRTRSVVDVAYAT